MSKQNLPPFKETFGNTGPGKLASQISHQQRNTRRSSTLESQGILPVDTAGQSSSTRRSSISTPKSTSTSKEKETTSETKNKASASQSARTEAILETSTSKGPPASTGAIRKEKRPGDAPEAVSPTKQKKKDASGSSKQEKGVSKSVGAPKSQIIGHSKAKSSTETSFSGKHRTGQKEAHPSKSGSVSVEKLPSNIKKNVPVKRFERPPVKRNIDTRNIGQTHPLDLTVKEKGGSFRSGRPGATQKSQADAGQKSKKTPAVKNPIKNTVGLLHGKNREAVPKQEPYIDKERSTKKSVEAVESAPSEDDPKDLPEEHLEEASETRQPTNNNADTIDEFTTKATQESQGETGQQPKTSVDNSPIKNPVDLLCGKTGAAIPTQALDIDQKRSTEKSVGAVDSAPSEDVPKAFKQIYDAMRRTSVSKQPEQFTAETTIEETDDPSKQPTTSPLPLVEPNLSVTLVSQQSSVQPNKLDSEKALIAVKEMIRSAQTAEETRTSPFKCPSASPRNSPTIKIDKTTKENRVPFTESCHIQSSHGLAETSFGTEQEIKTVVESTKEETESQSSTSQPQADSRQSASESISPLRTSLRNLSIDQGKSPDEVKQSTFENLILAGESGQVECQSEEHLADEAEVLTFPNPINQPAAVSASEPRRSSRHSSRKSEGDEPSQLAGASEPMVTPEKQSKRRSSSKTKSPPSKESRSTKATSPRTIRRSAKLTDAPVTTPMKTRSKSFNNE